MGLPTLPGFVMLRNAHGRTASINVDPGALAPVLFDELDLAIASLAPLRPRRIPDGCDQPMTLYELLGPTSIFTSPDDEPLCAAIESEIRADERAVIVATLARMARDAHSVGRETKAEALTAAARVIKNGAT